MGSVGTTPVAAQNDAPQGAASSPRASDAVQDTTAPSAARQPASDAGGSLLSDAFDLTRELAASVPGRALSTLLADLRAEYDLTTHDWRGRGRFRFVAAEHGRRLAGYAGAAAVAPRLDTAPPTTLEEQAGKAAPRNGLRVPSHHATSLPGLTAAEAELLIGAQCQLWDLTQRAFAPLLGLFPGLAAVLDPDTAPRWTGRASALGESSLAAFAPPVARAGPGQEQAARLSNPRATSAEAGGASGLPAPAPAPDLSAFWSQTAADRVVNSLARHPGHELLCTLAKAPAVRALLADEPELLWRRMEALRLALWEAGARSIPEVWSRHMHIGKTGPTRDRFRAVAAALALRRSLGVLHQLVYQRVLNMRPVVTDDILVSLPHSAGWTEIATGAVIRVIHPEAPRSSHQPWLADEAGECVGWAAAREVVGRDPQDPTGSTGAPFVELTFRGGGGSDYGEVYEFDVRRIDPWLNPLPGLVRDPLAGNEHDAEA